MCPNELFLPKSLSLRHTNTATENRQSIGSLYPDFSTFAFPDRLESLLAQHTVLSLSLSVFLKVLTALPSPAPHPFHADPVAKFFPKQRIP